MLDAFRIASIQPPETVERIVVPHMGAFAPRLLLSGLVFVLPFFFLYDLHGWWWGLALVLWLGSAWFGWWTVLSWSRTMVIFTNRRVIGPVRSGWLRRMGEFPRHELLEARWRPLRGLGGWFGFGKATFIGGPAKTAIHLSWCRGADTTIALPLAERRRQLAHQIGSCTEAQVAELEAWFAKQSKA